MKPIGISLGIGSHQRGTNTQIPQQQPPQSPGAYSHLSMNGTTDYIKTPSMTFDEIEIDGLFDSTGTDAYKYMFSDNISVTTRLQSNGFFTSNVLSSTGLVKDVRTTASIKFALKTSILAFFSRYTTGLTGYSMKGLIYSIKLKNAGAVVAHYDMTKGNVQDQSGNGNHATLTGGTWV